MVPRSLKWLPGAGGGAPILHAPAWLGAGLYAAVGTAMVCYLAWPGFMSFDSLFAYEEGLVGIQTMLWPPLHAYLFTLSQRLGAGAGGVLVLQSFVLFWSAAIIISGLLRSRVLAGLLGLAFLASFLYFPSQLGTLVAQWRDVPTASFALLSLALWLQAVRTRSLGMLAGAMAAAGVAVALRYNAFTLLFAALGAMLWRPFLAPAPSWRDRTVSALALILALGTAWASTQWRLPDLTRMPAPDSFGGTQQFDLFGISACSGRVYVPVAVSSGVRLTPAQARLAYEPTHLHLTLRPRPGLPPLLETDAGGLVRKTWGQAVREDLGCYLNHRARVLTEQLGLAAHAPFYPVHSGIDDNRFGLELASPARGEALKGYIVRNAGETLRRPYLLYLGALVAAGLIVWARRDLTLLTLAWLAGVFAYPAFLFIAAPAADGRYIFPSSTLAALLLVISAGLLIERRPAGGHDAS